MAVDTKPQEWETIAEAKRASLIKSIPKEWMIPKEIFPSETQLDVMSFPKNSGFFTGQELEITSTRIPALLEKIHNQSWTSEDVAKAFCKRAAVAHQLVSQLTWLRILVTDLLFVM